MTINLFSVIDHCAGIGTAFLVLASGAVAIDWLLRWCERHIKVTPSLLKFLHRTAMVLVVLDGAFILGDAGQETWLHLKQLLLALL